MRFTAQGSFMEATPEKIVSQKGTHSNGRTASTSRSPYSILMAIIEKELFARTSERGYQGKGAIGELHTSASRGKGERR